MSNITYLTKTDSILTPSFENNVITDAVTTALLNCIVEIRVIAVLSASGSIAGASLPLHFLI